MAPTRPCKHGSYRPGCPGCEFTSIEAQAKQSCAKYRTAFDLYERLHQQLQRHTDGKELLADRELEDLQHDHKDADAKARALETRTKALGERLKKAKDVLAAAQAKNDAAVFDDAAEDRADAMENLFQSANGGTIMRVEEIAFNAERPDIHAAFKGLSEVYDRGAIQATRDRHLNTPIGFQIALHMLAHRDDLTPDHMAGRPGQPAVLSVGSTFDITVLRVPTKCSREDKDLYEDESNKDVASDMAALMLEGNGGSWADETTAAAEAKATPAPKETKERKFCLPPLENITEHELRVRENDEYGTGALLSDDEALKFLSREKFRAHMWHIMAFYAGNTKPMTPRWSNQPADEDILTPGLGNRDWIGLINFMHTSIKEARKAKEKGSWMRDHVIPHHKERTECDVAIKRAVKFWRKSDEPFKLTDSFKDPSPNALYDDWPGNESPLDKEYRLKA